MLRDHGQAAKADAPTEDSIACTVKCRADSAVNRFQPSDPPFQLRPDPDHPRDNGDYSVVSALDDEMGNLMTWSCWHRTNVGRCALGSSLKKKAEAVTILPMVELLDSEEMKRTINPCRNEENGIVTLHRRIGETKEAA